MASNPNKPVAKSLHTISVLVAITRTYRGGGVTNESALAYAMKTLGLAGRADPYGLEAAALRVLDKESAQ